MDTIAKTARTCGIGAGFPKGSTTYLGGAIFWASHVTKGGPGDLLRCLAALGLSRGAWRATDAGRRADLLDLDGELRGEVLIADKEGASATLSSVTTRPLKCIA